MEKAEREALGLLNEEINRKAPDDDDALTEKWKVKIKIFLPVTLNSPEGFEDWNGRVTWIKLYPVDNKKDQLLAELTMPKMVPLGSVWHIGLGYSNTLVASLNIGTGDYSGGIRRRTLLAITRAY